MKRLLDWRLLAALLVFIFGMTVTSCGEDDEVKPNTVQDPDLTNPDGGMAVDLGLPTGTLWADRNIGAECPEDYGNYFAWGETTPKNTYDWSTYKWCNGTKDSQTKYCTISRNGTVDNLTILEPEDDAATANWGDRWRMPTSLEFEELLTYCTWEWTTQNNVIGYKVAGRNGNSIFLPAHLKVVSSVYWSKSLGELQSYGAWGLEIRHAYCGMFDYISRDAGCTVRAVVK
ncbi:MAG: hypothetical protein J6Q57_07595 [Paraprevotella sp.]|nr:hypothetical protein [Paraprevotella sp.]